MKRIGNGFIFILSLIKNFFFNYFITEETKNKKSVQKIENEQFNVNDEYHTAFSGVTRWQTL